MKVIIYPINNTIAVTVPSGTLPLEETAFKDTPAGVPFRYIDVSEIPSEENYSSWVVDFSDPDGYGKGHDWWFALQAEKEAQ